MWHLFSYKTCRNFNLSFFAYIFVDALSAYSTFPFLSLICHTLSLCDSLFSLHDELIYFLSYLVPVLNCTLLYVFQLIVIIFYIFFCILKSCLYTSISIFLSISSKSSLILKRISLRNFTNFYTPTLHFTNTMSPSSLGNLLLISDGAFCQLSLCLLVPHLQSCSCFFIKLEKSIFQYSMIIVFNCVF